MLDVWQGPSKSPWKMEQNINSTAQKMKFLLRISSVNVTKSVVSCEFDHIYWRHSSWKTLFFVQCRILKFFWCFIIKFEQAFTQRAK